MKNCEGTNGIYNRLMRGPGRSFQVIEAPRGRPFGGGAGHRNSGIDTSRNYWNCAIYRGNPVKKTKKIIKKVFMTPEE